MFIKAMTSNGMFQIFDDVFNVAMSLPETNFKLVSKSEDPEVKFEVNQSLYQAAVNATFDGINDEYACTWEEIEEYLSHPPILYTDPLNISAPVKLIFFQWKIDGKVEPRVIASSQRLFLCRDDGTTVAKW